MYGIIDRIGEFSSNPAGLISFLLGLVGGAVLFYLLVIPVHNYTKYRVVRWCGARVFDSSGHLSLSPRVSFSLVGFISTVVLGMGFAQPVYFELHEFRRPGVHTCVVSFTGLLVYLVSYLVSLVVYLVFRTCEIFSITSHNDLPVDAQWYVYVYFTFFVMLSYFRIYCIYSLLFNIIPFGPLDASEMLYMFLPVTWSDALRNNQTVTSFIVFVVAFLSIGKPDGFISQTALDINNSLVRFIMSLFGSAT